MATNSIRKARLRTRAHTFPNLSLGKYKLTVKKAGFRARSLPTSSSGGKDHGHHGELEGRAISETVEGQWRHGSPGGDDDQRDRHDDRHEADRGPCQSRVATLGQLSQLIPGYTGGQTTWWNMERPSFDRSGKQHRWHHRQSSRMKFGGNSAPAVTPRLESIEEMTVQTEQLDMNQGFGQASMQINFVTRRGSNAFHGRVFEDFRNAALNAQSWDNDALNAIDPANPQKKNPVKLNDFGGSIGGPIIKRQAVLLRHVRRVPSSRAR